MDEVTLRSEVRADMKRMCGTRALLCGWTKGESGWQFGDSQHPNLSRRQARLTTTFQTTRTTLRTENRHVHFNITLD